jgi:glycosyltransferase involved in cell wall biosynthesis
VTQLGEVLDLTHALGPTRSAPSLSLVVPLYNEEERLAESGEALAAFVHGYGVGSELILVDDGSRDATVEVARQLVGELAVPVRIVERPHLGKGAAVRAGLAVAGASVLAFCDVDLATPLAELGRIIAAAASAPVLAIGSRDVISTHLIHRENEVREFLGKSFNVLLRMTLTPGIFDTQCGAKAAHRAVWKEILPYCEEDGFAWDAEAIAIGRRRGVAVWEVGIAWRHDNRTRVRPLRDGARMVGSVPRILARVRQTPSLVAGPSARPIDLRAVEAEMLVVPSA